MTNDEIKLALRRVLEGAGLEFIGDETALGVRMRIEHE